MQTNEQLTPKQAWKIEHHPAIAELLEQNGMSPVLENGRIVELNWPEKNQDYYVVNFIMAHLFTIDFDVTKPLYTQLEESGFLALLENYLEISKTSFVKLQSSKIPVSPAHEGTTPYKHTMNVVEKLDVLEFIKLFENDKDKKNFIIQSIVNALLHDWGKIIIAQDDEHQYHAEISYLIARELSVLTEDQLSVIRFHHIFQLLDFKEISIEEIRNLFPDATSFAMLTVLASADVASVPKYEAYALGGLLDTIRCLSIEELNSTQATNVITLIHKQISAFFDSAKERLVQKDKYLKGKIEQIRVFVFELINAGVSVQAELIEDILKLIETNLKPEPASV